MTEQGYIKLYRKFKDWEWYTNINVKVLFLHCLLRANHKSVKYQGIQIDRGEFMTSIRTISIETGLSERQVRTALDKLILTNELTSKSNNKYRIIKVLRYNQYQDNDNQDSKQVTSKRQASDKPLTTNNNDKKEKNDNNDNKKHYENIELNELFLDFLQLRKKLKAVNSDRAINTLKNKIEHLSDNEKMQCINASIESSWKGLFPKEKKNEINTAPDYSHLNETYDDMSAENPFDWEVKK